MNYDEIMQSIKDGLYGDPRIDVRYLRDQARLFKTHRLSRDIQKGIDRLLFDMMPAEHRATLDRLASIRYIGISAALKKAEQQCRKRDYSHALATLRSAVRKIESGGDLIMYRDSALVEYRCFRNPFEEILFDEMYKSGRALRKTSEDVGRLYTVYGGLLIRLKRFDEAVRAFERAAGFNPFDTEALGELAEISRLRNDWERFLAVTKRNLHVAYTSRDMGRCYGNLGMYYSAKGDFEAAVALLYFSLTYDKQSKSARATLHKIRQASGMAAPSREKTAEIFRKYHIPSGPNELILKAAARSGKSAEEQKYYGAARFFYSILYDLTASEEVQGWINRLSGKH